MNLYLISQNVNNDYETYDSAVVVAESREGARNIHPSEYYKRSGDGWGFVNRGGEVVYEGLRTHNWCAVSEVKVDLIGQTGAIEAGSVICASYNAG